ncbi:MAG: 23S rRNA (pseudouridine(1915)-N(3))-methyltransferase RlmH [Terracidiphilus sp.]
MGITSENVCPVTFCSRPGLPDRRSMGYPPAVNLMLAHIGARPGPRDGFDALTALYLQRCSAFTPCRSEVFRSEKALLGWLDRLGGRTPAIAVLLDSRGRQMSSEGFAAWLGGQRDRGTQQMAFAVGPADGWSEAARRRAQLLLSLGPMTMAHSLARLVAAEQLYRALTILSGHPYHGGH